MAQAASTYLGEQRRRSTRLDQTFPLIIRGVDLLGQPFEERTATQNLSFQGCRYASKHHLPKNTWVTLETPSGDSRKDAICVRARVAWIQRPRTLRELFQVGVELEKGRNIWNVPFPPSDWNSEVTVGLSVVARGATNNKAAEDELSLEDYLRMVAHARGAAPTFEPESKKRANGALEEQLRQEFLEQMKKTVAEARATAEQLILEKASELQSEMKGSQITAKTFYDEWLKEFQRESAGVKEGIASAVMKNVTSQLADLRATLVGEWTEKLSHVQVEFSKWETDAQALHEEVRVSAEATLARSDERLKEKLVEIRRELEASLKTRTESRPEVPNPQGEGPEFTRAKLFEEFDHARKQWDELLETSLDGAAERLAERLTGSSQGMLRTAEHELASRVAQLQAEMGIATEANRAAIEELKASLARELSNAKDSMRGIEQAAANGSEYAKRFGAELQNYREESFLEHSVSLGKHAAQLETEFSKRISELLEHQRQSAAQRINEKIQTETAAALECVAKAAENLSEQEAHADNVLRIHRERLRQISEQFQRETQARSESDVAEFGEALGEARTQALTIWKVELATAANDSREEASAALKSEFASKLAEAGADMNARALRVVDSTEQKLREAMESMQAGFSSRLSETESDEMEKARIALKEAASQQLNAARREFAKVAETAASTLGEMIAEIVANALTEFSAATNARTEEARAQLGTEGESVLHNMQSNAQISFEHFQEQLAMKTDLALQRASGEIGRQFDSTLEKLRAEVDVSLQDWSVRQKSASEQALAKHEQQLQAGANSAIQSALEHLEQGTHDRIDTAISATERALRQACADVFESVAQRMREQLQGVAEMRPSNAGDAGQTEHRASA